jgi:late competence protein required for DNA uptake (superfamily II DNA/RNA helicase)
MDYKTGYSASWDWDKGKDHYERKQYSCCDCGQSLYDNETYYAYGSIYCGPCYQNK